MSDATGQLRAPESLTIVEEQGTVYLIPRGGASIRLNRTGSAFWRAIVGNESLTDAAGALIRAGQSLAETSLDDVEAFAERLASAGLLEVRRP